MYLLSKRLQLNTTILIWFDFYSSLTDEKPQSIDVAWNWEVVSKNEGKSVAYIYTHRSFSLLVTCKN